MVVLLCLVVFFMIKRAPKLSEEMEKMEIHEHFSGKMPKEEFITEDVKLKERDLELVFFVEEHERFTLEDLLQATADLRSESFNMKRLKKLLVTSNEFGEILRLVINILPLVSYRSTSEEKLLIYKCQSNGSLLFLLKGE